MQLSYKPKHCVLSENAMLYVCQIKQCPTQWMSDLVSEKIVFVVLIVLLEKDRSLLVHDQPISVCLRTNSQSGSRKKKPTKQN